MHHFYAKHQMGLFLRCKFEDLSYSALDSKQGLTKLTSNQNSTSYYYINQREGDCTQTKTQGSHEQAIVNIFQVFLVTSFSIIFVC